MTTQTETNLDCQKCGKPYQRAGMRRDKHIKECKGVPFVAPGGSPRAKAAGHRRETHIDHLIQGAKEKRGALVVERDQLQGQIDELDRGISGLEAAKSEMDKSLLTSHCTSCNVHIDETKKAQWDKYEIETAYHNIVNYNSQILLYLKRKGIKMPEQPELDQIVPMDHRKPFEPPKPNGSDPRANQR